MKTTRIELGTAKSQAGSLSVSYMIECQIVSLHASDPRDARKAGITMLLSQTEYAHLKTLFSQLDEVIDGNRSPAPSRPVPASKVVRVVDTGNVQIATSWGLITVSEAVSLKARELALIESRAEAIRYIAMGLAGVPKKALAEAIEELVRESASGDA